MAKVLGPALSLSASGSIKKKITFQKTPSGHKVYFDRSRRGIISAVQSARRVLFGSCIAQWKALTSGQKERWEQSTKHLPMNGYNYFMKECLAVQVAPVVLWPYRIKVTVLATKVDADLTDYPVYVDLSNLPAGFHSHVNQTDARDIRVTTSDGETEVPREVVSYMSATDTGELHFKGTVANAMDTIFYVYYGNPNASEPALDAVNGAEKVWDSKYKLVAHLKDATPSTIVDSTSNHADGSKKGANEPIEGTGKIGKGQSFDGIHDFIEIPDNANFDIQTDESVTIEAWVNIINKGLSGGDNYQYFIGKPHAPDQSYGWYMYTEVNGYLRFLLKDDGGIQVYVTDNLSLWGKGLVSVVATRNVTDDKLHLYVNGLEAIAAVTDTTTQAVTPTGGLDMGFLSQPVPSMVRFVKGVMDELRFSKSTSGPRVDGYISTTYNNQSSPSTFYVIGGEEAAGPVNFNP